MDIHLPPHLAVEMEAAQRFASNIAIETGGCGYCARLLAHEPSCVLCGTTKDLRVAVFLSPEPTATLYRLGSDAPLRALVYIACYSCDPRRLDARALHCLHDHLGGLGGLN